MKVPALRLPIGVHTGMPDEHTISAVTHGLLALHVMPAVHGSQLPIASHTPPEHAVPA